MLRGPPTEARVEFLRGHEVLEVVDALEARSLTILEPHAGSSIRAIQLFGALSRRPLRLELGQEPLDLAEIHPIAARVRTAVRGVLDTRARNDVMHDVGELANAIVFGGLAHVERLVVDRLTRRRE